LAELLTDEATRKKRAHIDEPRDKHRRTVSAATAWRIAAVAANRHLLRATCQGNVLFFDRKSAAEKHWTEKLWIYDLRTNKHFTLKENPLKQSDPDDFVACYNPKNRHERKESERFESFTSEELIKRDKLNLDIFWLKDESLEDSAPIFPNPTSSPPKSSKTSKHSRPIRSGRGSRHS